MKRLVVLAAALFIFAAPRFAAAQVDRATLTGIVKDSAGADVPGATLTVTNLDTNVIAAAAKSVGRVGSIDIRWRTGSTRRDRFS